MRFKFLAVAAMLVSSLSGAPLRVAIVGLNHGHISGFLNGGALVPAGGAWHRPDIQIVGIVEPDRALFDSSAERLHLPANLYFASIAEMAAKTHPDAALVFTSTYGHTAAVEECAKRGIHVMMEKPMAVSYKDALAIERAAKANHIHVLVDYETTWYSSNKAAYDLRDEIGGVRKGDRARRASGTQSHPHAAQLFSSGSRIPNSTAPAPFMISDVMAPIS